MIFRRLGFLCAILLAGCGDDGSSTTTQGSSDESSEAGSSTMSASTTATGTATETSSTTTTTTTATDTTTTTSDPTTDGTVCGGSCGESEFCVDPCCIGDICLPLPFTGLCPRGTMQVTPDECPNGCLEGACCKGPPCEREPEPYCIEAGNVQCDPNNPGVCVIANCFGMLEGNTLVCMCG